MNVVATTIEGSLRNTIAVTFLNPSDTAQDLTGATVTATIEPANGNVQRAATGTFALVTAASGTFTWTPSAADVATPGIYIVQFNAAYASGATPAKSRRMIWIVEPSN